LFNKPLFFFFFLVALSVGIGGNNAYAITGQECYDIGYQAGVQDMKAAETGSSFGNSTGLEQCNSETDKSLADSYGMGFTDGRMSELTPKLGE
jgi:hypothetical protein